MPQGGPMGNARNPWLGGGGGGYGNWNTGMGGGFGTGAGPLGQHPAGMGQGPMGGGQPAAGGFNAPYATDVSAYMNPYLSSIIDRGTHAIENSAAAKGGLFSTGTAQDIGDWAANAQAQAYQQAFQNFMSDRNYMTDNYRDARNFNYGGYRDNVTDYNQRMGLQYGAEQGLANNAQDWSKLAMAQPILFAQIMAQLFGDRGNAQAAGGINAANINSNMFQQFLSWASQAAMKGGAG